ncbi:hypothetical protein ABIB50_005099 [Mucilaginibacter sp. UYCu711]
MIVAINSRPGYYTPGNADHMTTHFVVIVGSGVEADGRRYFRFYENATSSPVEGRNKNNKLYYDPVALTLQGTSVTSYHRGVTFDVLNIRRMVPSF